MTALGFEEDEEKLKAVCASNLIFHRSQTLNHLLQQLTDKSRKPEKPLRVLRQELEKVFMDYAQQCWPLREFIISEIVKPQYVVVFGNGTLSPFFQKAGRSSR